MLKKKEKEYVVLKIETNTLKEKLIDHLLIEDKMFKDHFNQVQEAK